MNFFYYLLFIIYLTLLESILFSIAPLRLVDFGRPTLGGSGGRTSLSWEFGFPLTNLRNGGSDDAGYV